MASATCSIGRCTLPSAIAPQGVTGGNRLRPLPERKTHTPARQNKSVASRRASLCQGQALRVLRSLDSARLPAPMTTAAWPENGLWVGERERARRSFALCCSCGTGYCSVRTATPPKKVSAGAQQARGYLRRRLLHFAPSLGRLCPR